MWKRHLAVLGLGIIIALSLWLGWGLWQTQQAVQVAQKLEFEQAAVLAQAAQPVPKSLNWLTFHTVPDLKAWQNSLQLLINIPAVIDSYQIALNPSLAASEVSSETHLTSLVKQAQILDQDLEHSWVIKRLFPRQVATFQSLLADLLILDETVFSGRRTWLVLFQNTHELRATGGFIGSYALVTLNDSRLEKIEIQDIYVPDGQFIGLVTAPPGVQEYLSSGKGLRLPDANWWPDFPASAQQVLAYFALGRESDIDGVVAVNSEVAESLLALIGDVFVPDYQVTLTADNFSTLLRTQRQDFFPGSIGKQHLLASAFNQVKFRLASLSSQQQGQLVSLLRSALAHKHIQVYALDPVLQDWLVAHHWAGVMTANTTVQSQPADLYLSLIESNVGINKANPGVSRQVTLNLGPTEAELIIEFTNSNAPPATSTAQPAIPPDQSPHYVNYQRIFVPTTVEVVSLLVNQSAVPSWDEEIVTSSTGEHFKQLGFLVTVPAQAVTTVQLDLQYPELPTPAIVKIQKQAGLAPTFYTVTSPTQKQDFWLETDQEIIF